MNVIDSSVWLEYFSDGPQSADFALIIERPELQIVPTITLYEVFKRVMQQRGENDALQAIATMMQGAVVELSPSLALSAARLSPRLRLPMADSIILATARAYDAVLWSQDDHFASIPGVRFVPKHA